MLITGDGRSGTTALARMFAAAFPAWRHYCPEGSPNFEDQMTLDYLGDNRVARATERAARRTLSDPHWMTKVPWALVHHHNETTVGWLCNVLVISRDPVATTLSHHRADPRSALTPAVAAARQAQVLRAAQWATQEMCCVGLVSCEKLMLEPARILEVIGRWSGETPDVEKGVAQLHPNDPRYWGPQLATLRARETA